MRAHKSIVRLICLAILATPSTALATTGSVTISFGGLCNPITIAQPPPFYLFLAGGSFTCSSGGTNYFKIEDNGASRAQVLPSSGAGSDSDGADDTLRIKDWKITAITPTPTDRPQGYEVSIWLTFGSNPTTDGPGGSLPDVYYKSTLYGSITKRAGNWVTMSPGYVTNPVGGAETTLGTAKTYYPTCALPTCSLTGLSTSGKWPDNPNFLSGNRILRTKYSFSLKAANDVFLINSTGGKLNSQGSAETDPDECSEQYCRCRSIFKIITVSTWNFFGTTSGKSDQTETSKVEMFTKANWASLQQDMARGTGEYLASLAALWGIPIDEQPAFFSLAQDVYRSGIEVGLVRRVDLLTRLQEERLGQRMLTANIQESIQ